MPSSPRRTFSTPAHGKRLIQILIVVGVLLCIADYGLRLVSRRGLTDRLLSRSSSTSSPIPHATGEPLTFPALPAGMYTGSISDLFAGHTLPLTIISFPEQQKLSVVIGMTGWTPTEVDVNAKADDDPAAKGIKVRSNGFVLALTGEAGNGEVSGTFKNLITKESGQWSIKPVK